MTSNAKTQIIVISHKDDAVIIEVEDLAAFHDDAKRSPGSIGRYPYRWSTVKTQLIAASIFTALQGSILESELRLSGRAHQDTVASPSEVVDVINNLPKV